MANYSAIKAAVNGYIRQNGRKEITGKVLNAVLNAVIDSLGRYFQFAGGAMPTDDPGTPDQNVCYLATEPGLYVHFNNIRINNEEVALLFWNGEWVKQTIAIGIQGVEASVDNNSGTPSVDVSYSQGQLVLTFHNIKGDPGQPGQPGDPGQPGEPGQPGASAGFGTIDADIVGGVGTPSVSVETSGDNTSKNMIFHFANLKGEQGIQGEPGLGLEDIETPNSADGTAALTLSNGDIITLDLNHNHGQYTKVRVCEDFAEYSSIAVKDPMTFYVIPEVALYLGSILVVSQSETPLPYTPVAYIETDGTAYIDTGVKGNAPMSASFKMTPVIPASGNTYFLGCRKDSGATRFIMLTISSTKGCGYTYGSGAWGSVIDISDSVNNQTPMDVIVSYRNGSQNLGVKQDGESSFTTYPRTIAEDINTDINIFLFAYNNAGIADVCESGSRCHGLKLYADYNYNTLIFDGVPAYYNGEYGLWDKVSKTFLGNAAGSGSISGPSI